MSELSSYYLRILEIGFIVLRQAIESHDENWIETELDFLHNIPSLVNEANQARHEYFWNKERPHYLERINTQANEFAKSRMRTFYLPILEEMKPIVDRYF